MFEQIILAVVYGFVMVCVAAIIMRMVVNEIHRYKALEAKKALQTLESTFKMFDENWPKLWETLKKVFEGEMKTVDLNNQLVDACEKQIEKEEAEKK